MDEQAEEAPASRSPTDPLDPPWCNDREQPPSSTSRDPLSSAPDSMWSDPDDETDDDEERVHVDDGPKTSPYPSEQDSAQSSAEPVISSGSPLSSMTPESALVHSSGNLHTVRTAAAHMGIKPKALQRQCRAGANANGVVDLGEGILAFKIGRFWRVRFPWWQ